MIFQQKYVPKSFDDLIFADSSTRKRLLEFARNNRHNSFMFQGPYGTAKTTTAKLLVEARSPDLEYGGIDFYRANDLDSKTFERIANVRRMQLLAGVEVPVTIIDEIDQVSDELQYTLRWELDRPADDGCFIFTTNKLHKVDAGLVDRCDVADFPSANSAQWFERARTILDAEGVKLPDAQLTALLGTCDGSIRDLMRALEDAVLRRPRAA